VFHLYWANGAESEGGGVVVVVVDGVEARRSCVEKVNFLFGSMMERERIA
jgi:hypothetical protein